MIRMVSMRRPAPRVTLHIVIILFFSWTTPATGVTRIMPVGDSITKGTYGSVNKWGYRQPLYVNLTNGGYIFDFVGDVNDGNFPDPNHEGHNGWHTDEILNGAPYEPWAGKLEDWLTAHQPDVVLLHIGTNDITWGDQDVNEVNDILDAIDEYEADSNETVTMVLALIINRRIDSPPARRAATTQFNLDVNNMAMGRIASGDDIIIVDMEGALDYNVGADMADEVHPNDNGYGKMATVWYNALLDYFGSFDFTISGHVVELDGNTPVDGVLIEADNSDINTISDINGYYELRVDYGWSGIITPQKEGYVFEPNKYTYADVNQDYNDMNYTATLTTFGISGYVFEQDYVTPISDVNVSAENGGGNWTSRYGGGSTLTDANGYYEVRVDYRWPGKVKPSKCTYVFEPNSRYYEDVNEDTGEDQNYIGTELDFKITGYIKNECETAIEGVLVDANNGGDEDTTDANGFYEVWVDEGWSGTVTPMKPHFTFDPNRRSYVNVLADQPDQNYIAGCIYDLDCNGYIGWGDVKEMTENWLLSGPELPGDFVADEHIDFLDSADFGAAWKDK